MPSTLNEFLERAEKTPISGKYNLNEVVPYGQKRHDYTVTLKISTVADNEVKAKKHIKKYMQTVGNKSVAVTGMKIE